MMRTAGLLAVVAVMLACEQGPDVPPAQSMEGADTTDAQVESQPGTAPGAPVDTVAVDLIGGDGAAVGVAWLTSDNGGVRVAIRVTGLTPGEHGFHVHETGLCEPPSFASAGSHFAPHGRQHGLQNPEGPHAGDLPNLNAGANGSVDTVFVAPNLSLRAGEPHALLREVGTALMIHAGPDDHRTDPSGDSGARVVCGVIRSQ